MAEINEQNNITEITVKVILIGEYHDFDSWIKGNQTFRNLQGITTPTIHLDSNGYATNGFDLTNFKKEAPYPVKSYVFVKNPDIDNFQLQKSHSSL